MRTVGHQPQVALLAADSAIDQAVEATIGAGQHAGMQARAELAEMLRLTLETHHTCRSAGAPDHRLRALGHAQQIIGFRRNIGAGRVHPSGAGAEHLPAIGEQQQA